MKNAVDKMNEILQNLNTLRETARGHYQSNPHMIEKISRWKIKRFLLTLETDKTKIDDKGLGQAPSPSQIYDGVILQEPKEVVSHHFGNAWEITF
jgi:hypothetical protein